MAPKRTGPQIEIQKKSGAVQFGKRLAGLSKLAAYVGVPAASKGARKTQILSMADRINSKKRKAYLVKAAESDVTNAELLFIHTKGSKLKGIPPRPVIEPAIAAEGNKEAISNELNKSIKAMLDGDRAEAIRRMQRTALAGQNAARKWFTDGRNNWKENAQSTIDRKGSNKPLIDTGALRNSIVGIVREE